VRLRTVVAYGVMVAVALALYLWIRARGLELVATAEPAGASLPRSAGGESTFAHVLLSLALITLATRLVGGAFQRWLGQPPVMGRSWPGSCSARRARGALARARAFVLPADAAPVLGVISSSAWSCSCSWSGSSSTRACCGASRDGRDLAREHPGAVPARFGARAALYPTHATRDVDFTASRFLGVALSVTAFPVLARILRTAACNDPARRDGSPARRSTT
jgi:hypothetical protein